MMRLVLLALVACIASAPAFADGAVVSLMTPADKAKLAAYEATREKAISEARAGGTPADLVELDKAFSGSPVSLHENFDPTGAWRCRVLKLGGGLPLTVYGWFDCRIADDGAGWRLEKRTGSQRTSGQFYDDGDTRLIYLGALHYGDQQPVRYGADGKRNQVAYVFRTGEKRMRLEFPAPEFESIMDVLEMERR
jgi:hypothetical protein